MIAEAWDLRLRFGIRHIKFQDDYFGARRGWMEEFCDRYAKEGPPVTWNCSSSPMFFRDGADGLLRLMRRAGCVSIHFGLQSATPAILKRVNRHPEEPEVLRRITPLMKELGFLTVIDFIYGLPGETEETMEENLRFALACGVHLIQVNPLVVVPHTELHERAGDGPLPSPSQEAVLRAAARAHRVFYMRPRAVRDVASWVARHNPGAVAELLRVVPHGLGIALGVAGRF